MRLIGACMTHRFALMRDLSARIEQQLARIAEYQTLASRWRALEDERAGLETELRVLAERSGSIQPVENRTWREALAAIFDTDSEWQRAAATSSPDEDAMRAALRQLRAIEAERNATLAAMNERSSAEDELLSLLEAKAQSLIDAGHHLSSTIEESARTIVTLRQRLQLTDDAVARADSALAHVQELLDSLSTANSWSMLDCAIDGGPGTVVSIFKHRELRQTAEIAQRARASIEYLSERVSTSGLIADDPWSLRELQDQIAAADIFSDVAGVGVDMAMLARVQRWEARAEDCAERLRAMLRALHSSARALDVDLQSVTAARRALLLNA